MILSGWLSGLKERVASGRIRRSGIQMRAAETETLEQRVVLSVVARDDAYDLESLSQAYNDYGQSIGYKVPIYTNDTYPQAGAPFQTLLGSINLKGTVRAL